MTNAPCTTQHGGVAISFGCYYCGCGRIAQIQDCQEPSHRTVNHPTFVGVVTCDQGIVAATVLKDGNLSGNFWAGSERELRSRAISRSTHCGRVHRIAQIEYLADIFRKTGSWGGFTNLDDGNRIICATMNERRSVLCLQVVIMGGMGVLR